MSKVINRNTKGLTDILTCKGEHRTVFPLLLYLQVYSGKTNQVRRGSMVSKESLVLTLFQQYVAVLCIWSHVKIIDKIVITLPK